MADQDFQNLKKIISPAGLQVQSNYLKIGDKFVKSFFVFSYPRYLSSGWFEPLISATKISTETRERLLAKSRGIDSGIKASAEFEKISGQGLGD